MLVYIAFVATLTLWIIHFESEDHNLEVIITDNLKAMNIGVFEDISDISKNQNIFSSTLQKYNRTEDPYGILSSEKSRYNVSIKMHISDANIDKVLKHKNEHTYYEIYFPMTKTLFFKVINLTSEDDVKFTTDEICSVLKHLFMYLEDKFCVSSMIFKNILDDPSLYDQLECRCNEQIDDGTDISLMFSSLIVELANCAVLVITDDYENIAVASAKHHERKRLPIHTKLNEMIGLFLIQHLTVDADFISQNNEFLYNLCVNTSRELTVTIDFTTIKYVQHTNDTVTNMLEELSSSTFLQLENVRVIDIHLSYIIIDFDLNFLKNKLIDLVCNDCTLLNGIKLPEISNKLFLEDCHLNANLIMPENITTIIFRNVVIAEDVFVNVNNNAKHIEFINIIGCVHIPNIKANLHIMEYNMYWPFKQVKDANGTIEKLLITHAVFEKMDIDFCQKIKKLVLKNIDLDNLTTITIRHNVETVHIEEFSGTVHLHDSIVHSGLLTVKLNKGNLSIQEEISTQTTDTKHNVEKHKKLLLKNADIISYVSFSDDLFEIYFVNVAFSDCQKPLRLKWNIFAVHLDKCNGPVSFNNIGGLNQILFKKKSNQLLIFNKSLQTGKAVLSMENITFYNNVTLNENISNILLVNIKCANNSILSIHCMYDKFDMSGCQGKYRIPGISQNGQPIIDISKRHNMGIKLQNVNTYDIYVKYTTVEQPWTIGLDINDLELYNIRCTNRQGSLKFTGLCRNVSLTYISCMISFVNVESFNKVYLKHINHSSFMNKILRTPTRYIEINQVGIDTDLIFCNQVEYASIVHAYNSLTNISSHSYKILLNSNCKNISALYNNVKIDMSTIIGYYKNNNVIYTTISSQFMLITADIADFTHLMLKSFCMDDDWKLKRKVKSLELNNITSVDKNTKFIITHELDNISIIDSNINISLLHPCKLKRMSITKSEMIYNPTIYTSVEYISLVSTEITEVLVFPNSVRIVYLEDVNIKGKVEVGSHITSLSIINVTGLVDMFKTVINHAFELQGREVIQLEKTASGYSLSMHNVYFSSDYQFSSNIQIIKLNNINICNCTVKISDCHHVEISSCPSLVISESDDEIKGLVDGNISNGQLVLSNIHTLKLYDMELLHSVEMHSCIRTVILEQIEIIDNMQFIVNPECEEVHLLLCKGILDIRKIERLKKLSFISLMDLCILLKNDKQLNDLHDLEIGGDVDDNFIISVLSHCNSLKRLTLSSSALSPKICRRIMIILNKKNHFFVPTIDHTNFLSKVFSFTMINKLEYLDISGLFLDYKKIKTWKYFKELHTLVVNSHDICFIPLGDIPSNIKTLKCIDNHAANNKRYGSKSYRIRIPKILENHKNIRRLIVKETTFHNICDILLRLPPYLETLEIETSTIDYYLSRQENESKSYVKELILRITSNDDVMTIKQENLVRRNYVNILNYFREFIDFDKLEQFIIETNTTRMHLNVRMYQIE